MRIKNEVDKVQEFAESYKYIFSAIRTTAKQLKKIDIYCSLN